MSSPKTDPVPLPVVPHSAGQSLRISPTDVSQFVRLEQCERYLRFRLAERSGGAFMREYDVAPQRIAPLLSKSGREFEEAVEKEIALRHASVQYADRVTEEVDRPINNDAVLAEIRNVLPDCTLVLFQPRLQAEIDDWLIRGDVDVVRLHRRADGTLHVLIVDIKSTTEAKTEHRLQLAFYRLMLARLCEQAGLPLGQIQTAVLFRRPVEATPEQEADLRQLREAAKTWLGLDDALLEVVSDPDAYAQAARDLVLGPASVARRVALAPFEAVPFALSYKCDGCMYAEYCLKWSAVSGFAEVELVESYGGEWSKGFVFGGIMRPLDEGRLYTLDPCPNDWYGYWSMQVVEGLCRGEGNVLYELLADPTRIESDPAPTPGQARFLAGVYSFQAAKTLHDFEKAKRQYIGNFGKVPVLLVQCPPGTGKSYGTAFAIFARLQGAMQAGKDFRAFVSCKTHAATDVLLQNIIAVRDKLKELRDADANRFAQFFDPRLLDVPLFRVAPREPPPDLVVHLPKDAEKEKGAPKNADVIQQHRWCVVAVTPGGVYGMMKGKWDKDIFDHGLCDCLVLDEASQMGLPEAAMATLPLKRDGQLIVAGDHRQMPPVVKHVWDRELRRTFQQYRVFESLFDTLRSFKPPMIQFSESFRVHAAIAEFLRREIYVHDGIAYHSQRTQILPARHHEDAFVAAVLQPDYPLVVVVHGEAASQTRNEYEQSLIEPVVRTLSDPAGYALGAEHGLGVVVPHRAQRATLQTAFPQLCVFDQGSGLPTRSAIDTVERFQGSERTVIVVSATESDRAYLLEAGEFLLDPRRLTVALSRAKQKLVLVAAESVFTLFSPDDEAFAGSLLWKSLLLRTCTAKLWEGERNGNW